MALPQLNSATYELTVPSSGDLVKYRPYLVKEEKILMLALESSSDKQILNATADIINACTFGAVDASKLPMVDLEYIFLKLRSKSVGESTRVGLKCSECQSANEVSINLESVEPVFSNNVENKIQLTDEIGIVMKLPTVSDMQKNTKKDQSELDTVFAVMISSIDSVYDAENVYPAVDSTYEELMEFLESLNQEQFGKVQKWFESMPKLSHEVKFMCTNCQHGNQMMLQGLTSFFG